MMLFLIQYITINLFNQGFAYRKCTISPLPYKFFRNYICSFTQCEVIPLMFLIILKHFAEDTF
jgi:hypothetical protein